ncbi:MAG: hypothetical protein ACR2GH_10620 [Pseudonocardia sp.]
MLELRPVPLRHAEQLADHQRGHRDGELRDEVDRRAEPLHRVQPVRDDPLDPGCQLLQPPHGELTGEQPS